MVQRKLHLVIFFAAFFSISVIEGIHFILDLRFLYFFLFILPFVLFALDTKKRYAIPKYAALLIASYVFFSLLSLINSLQRGVSLDLFIRDMSLILLLVYSHQHKEEIRSYLPKLILFLSFIFIAASIVCLITPSGREFISGVRLNLLYNPAYLHKTIGDYLTLGVIICLFFVLVKNRKRWAIPLIVLLPVFVLSFSRTAYITLAVSFLTMLLANRAVFKKIPRSRLYVIGAGAIMLCIILVTFVTKTGIAPLTKIQQAIQSTLYPRTFLSSRTPYWAEGLEGVKLYGLYGVGQGNFSYLSYRLFTTFFAWSNTSFNLIIDMLAEQGIAVTLSFTALVLYILFTAKRNDVFFLLLATLFVSFMGFSTYSYIQIWLLFFVLAGSAMETRDTDISFRKNLLLVPACLGIIYIQTILLHYMFIYYGNRQLAQDIYPFDRENTEALITQAVNRGDETQATAYLTRYKSNFKPDPFVLEYIGDSYARMGQPYYKEALAAYDDSLVWGSYIYGDSLEVRMKKIYDVRREEYGNAEAKDYVARFLSTYRKAILVNPSPVQQELYDKLVRHYLR